MRIVTAALAAVLVAVGSAGAQPPGPRPAPSAPPRPGLSPYLNLLQPGSAAVNYYGLVRPQLEFRNALQNLSGQIGAVAAGREDPQTGLPFTGHPVVFNNTAQFFNSNLGSRPSGIALRPLAAQPPSSAPHTGGPSVPGGRR